MADIRYNENGIVPEEETETYDDILSPNPELTQPVAPPGQPPVADLDGGNSSGVQGAIIQGIANRFTARVRFFNAIEGSFPLNVSVGNRVAAQNLYYGGYSNYLNVSGGVHTVVVTASGGPRMIYYSENLPFMKGVKMTFIIVNTEEGIDLLPLTDYN